MASSRWEILKHEQLEELCVLAASGSLDSAGLEQVRAHLDECASCQALFADIGDVHAIHLSEIQSTVTAPDHDREIRIKNLILLGARNEGAHFSQPLESPAHYEKPRIELIGLIRGIRGWSVAASVCVLGACLATALALRQTHESKRGVDPVAPQVGTSVHPGPDVQSLSAANRDEEPLRGRVTSLEAERSRLERLLKESHSENGGLQNEISEGKQHLEALLKYGSYGTRIPAA